MTLPADQLERDLDYLGMLVNFPWHAQQLAAMNARTDTVVVLGGSRAGKSTTALGIVSRLVRREGPIYRRLRAPEHRPLKIWVAPLTFEKYQSVWEPRLIRDVFAGIRYDYVTSPHHVFTWDDACAKGNSVWGKTSDQGYMSFESDEVDLVVFDEEPEDQKVYTAAVQRFATTNGVVVLAYSPLRGMTWTHSSLYTPVVTPDRLIAPRVWQRGQATTVVQMGMADNPAAVEGGGVQRLQDDVSISAAERNTRLYGEYGFAEGLIWSECADLIPGGHSPYLLDALPPGPFHWVLTADPNKAHGAILCAIDAHDNWIVVAEHYAENLPDTLHARAYLNILRSLGLLTPQGHVAPEVGVYADPGGAGAQAIINMGETGLYAQPVKKDAGSVSASIKSIRRRLWVDPGHRHPVTGVQGAPHLYVLRGLRSRWVSGGVPFHDSRLMWELRQYRQKDGSPPDTPIKEHDHLVDCLRYVALVRPTTAPGHRETPDAAVAHLDYLSRRAHTEFDDTVKRAMQPSRTREVEVW